MLDLLAMHPQTAHHIAYQLSQRFVADEPPASLVDRAAKTFLSTKGDIREVVRTIITSPEFFSVDAYRAKVKTPLEFVVSAARALGADPDSTPRLANAVARLGQPLYRQPSPAGYPERQSEWVNSGALLIAA